MCEVPSNANSWDDLNNGQKKQLVNSFYPRIIDFAIETKQLIEGGIIKIIRYDEKNLKYIITKE